MQVEAELTALEARPGTAEVVVVGTGYAGMELATTVAERLGSQGQVRMVTAGKPPPTSWLHSAGGHARNIHALRAIHGHPWKVSWNRARSPRGRRAPTPGLDILGIFMQSSVQTCCCECCS